MENNNRIIQEEIKLIIVKYLTSELTEDEAIYLKKWIAESEWNDRFFKEINSVWYASGVVGNIRFDVEKAWKEVSERLHLKKNDEQPVKRRMFTQMMKYAAIVVFALAIGGLISYFAFSSSEKQTDNIVEFSVRQGSKSSLILSDGTRIWLNSGSVIRYDPEFGMGERTVELEGEAYFEVAKNEKIPFVVNTEKLNIKVLGTEFNVRSYPGDNSVATTLIEGSVKIEDKTSASGKILIPGQQLVFDKTKNTMRVQEVDTAIYTAWMDGKIFFRQTPIGEVFSEIERHYGVKIVAGSDAYRDRKITGRFDLDKSPEDILDIIRETIPFSYRKVNDTIYINYTNK